MINKVHFDEILLFQIWFYIVEVTIEKEVEVEDL